MLANWMFFWDPWPAPIAPTTPPVSLGHRRGDTTAPGTVHRSGPIVPTAGAGRSGPIIPSTGKRST